MQTQRPPTSTVLPSIRGKPAPVAWWSEGCHSYRRPGRCNHIDGGIIIEQGTGFGRAAIVPERTQVGCSGAVVGQATTGVVVGKVCVTWIERAIDIAVITTPAASSKVSITKSKSSNSAASAYSSLTIFSNASFSTSKVIVSLPNPSSCAAPKSSPTHGNSGSTETHL